MHLNPLILTATLAVIPLLQAAPVVDDQTTEEARNAITRELQGLDADIPIERIDQSEWEGVFRVILKGGNVIYANKTGKLLLRGDMLEIKHGQIVNLTEAIRNQAVADQLSALKTEELIVFPAKEETKGIVYVFTDVDCGYCRKLHQEMPELNNLGIEVRYLAFPRGGKQSPAYNKMVAAWCSPDRKKALSELKAGKTMADLAAEKDKDASPCAALVEQQFQLGIDLGVSGTPALFLESGQAISGYRPAAELARIMGITAAPAPGIVPKQP